MDDSHQDKNKPATNEPAEEKPSAEENEPAISPAEYKKIQKELSECREKHVRLYADLENSRKRQERERSEYIRFANEGLIANFLDILDDLERTVQAASSKHQDYDLFLQGVEMVMAHIYELLKKNQVKPIEALGKKFDPHFHEVLMQEESLEQEEGTVTEEFQKGYYLGDKVIRTSKVKVTVPKR